MTEDRITVKVFRYNPAMDDQSQYQVYEVPLKPGMSAMNILEYISMNLDPTLAFYDHAACCLGICGRCTARINGKPGLLCQTPVMGDVTLDPLDTKRVVRDLITGRKAKPL